jgi:hypothetical protein
VVPQSDLSTFKLLAELHSKAHFHFIIVHPPLLQHLPHHNIALLVLTPLLPPLSFDQLI